MANTRNTNDINPFAYHVEKDDQIVVLDQYTEREVTVIRTVDDRLGYGIVVETESGREFTIGPDQFISRV